MKPYVVIPIAGPDYISVDGIVKGLLSYKNEPFLKYILDSRPWARFVDSENYIFVLHESPESRTFKEQKLNHWYPGCKSVFLSEYTDGAATSALAGVLLVTDRDSIIIVDLADIYYETDIDIVDIFSKHKDTLALAFTFISTNPIYSYLRFENLSFVEAKEKQVISQTASAGTYVFKNRATYIKALNWYITYGEEYMMNNAYYVCPLLNGLADDGVIRAWNVHNHLDMKI